MTSNMKRALTRVDGVTTPVGPIHIFGPESAPANSTSATATRRAREARRRTERLARTLAGVLSARVPRTLEGLLLNEPSDLLIHQDLAAAGLL
jgi:hypothetical protein